MIDVGDNFGNREAKCIWCKVYPDKQRHILDCSVIKKEIPEISVNSPKAENTTESKSRGKQMGSHSIDSDLSETKRDYVTLVLEFSYGRFARN